MGKCQAGHSRDCEREVETMGRGNRENLRGERVSQGRVIFWVEWDLG